MSGQWEQLNPKDAIELQEKFADEFIKQPMFKTERIHRELLKKALNFNDWDGDNEYCVIRRKWDQGLNAEVLKVGGNGWKKGKVRINVTMEFLPDEPESPLDDIRKNMALNE